jgi:hypothetical protein
LLNKMVAFITNTEQRKESSPLNTIYNKRRTFSSGRCKLAARLQDDTTKHKMQ